MKNLLLTMIIAIFVYADVSLIKPLVSAQWLSNNIDDVKILDVRKQTMNYAAIGHIEGSILVNVKDIRVIREINGKKITKMIPSKDDFDKLISYYGVNTNDIVIITHEGNIPGDLAGAARLYWQFKVYGFENVAILDGGNKAWVNDTLEDLEQELSQKSIGKFKTNKTNKNIIAFESDILSTIKNEDKVLIDARDMRAHIGLSKKNYVYKNGHIIKSKNFFYKFLTPRKGSTKIISLKKIKKAFRNMGIDIKKPMIIYCNSGYEASSVWFVLHELIGNKNISVFDGSLHQWTMDKNNLMTTVLGK